MKYHTQSILIITITLFGFCSFVLGQTNQTLIATTEDGRKVILKSDGTWEFQSKTETKTKNENASSVLADAEYDHFWESSSVVEPPLGKGFAK